MLRKGKRKCREGISRIYKEKKEKMKGRKLTMRRKAEDERGTGNIKRNEINAKKEYEKKIRKEKKQTKQNEKY